MDKQKIQETINEIQELKRQAESSINDILKQFQNKTGVIVSDLTYTPIEITSYSDTSKQMQPKIFLSLEFPESL